MSASPSPYSPPDKAKLIVAALIVIGAVVAFYVLANSPAVVRLGIVLGGVVLALGVGWTSQPGKDFFVYGQDSLAETKKVVWPSRKETLQTTAVVVAFVVVMAIFLWFVDASLVWLVHAITSATARPATTTPARKANGLFTST